MARLYIAGCPSTPVITEQQEGWEPLMLFWRFYWKDWKHHSEEECYSIDRCLISVLMGGCSQVCRNAIKILIVIMIYPFQNVNWHSLTFSNPIIAGVGLSARVLTSRLSVLEPPPWVWLLTAPQHFPAGGCSAATETGRQGKDSHTPLKAPHHHQVEELRRILTSPTHNAHQPDSRRAS